MNLKAVFFISAMVLLSVNAAAQDNPDQQTWRGLLVDAHYAGDLLSYESLAQKAKKYTKESGLKREAKESGYGIVVRDKFYAFDAKGNELALELLRRTTKESRIEVEVSGVLPRSSDSGAAVENTSISPKPGTPRRDRIGRPTYDQVPGQTTEGSYGTSATLGGRRRGSSEKIIVESIKEIEPGAVKPSRE